MDLSYALLGIIVGILMGSVPGIVLGSYASGRFPDSIVRRLLATVLLMVSATHRCVLIYPSKPDDVGK